MRNSRPLILCSLIALVATSAEAAPGDVVVPAHRTKDGHWVPANVPPISGGTRLARRPGRAASHQANAQGRGQLMPPLLVEAQPIRR